MAKLTKAQKAQAEQAQIDALEAAIEAQIAADNDAPDDLTPIGFEELIGEERLKELLDEDEDEDDARSPMARALDKARGAYTKSVASSGKKSLHNGDELATLLAGCEPEEVCQLADIVCEVAAGTHLAKYKHLNQGQIRMNAGNKVRGRIKRGEILPSTVIDLAKTSLETLKSAI